MGKWLLCGVIILTFCLTKICARGEIGETVRQATCAWCGEKLSTLEFLLQSIDAEQWLCLRCQKTIQLRMHKTTLGLTHGTQIGLSSDPFLYSSSAEALEDYSKHVYLSFPLCSKAFVLTRLSLIRRLVPTQRYRYRWDKEKKSVLVEAVNSCEGSPQELYTTSEFALDGQGSYWSRDGQLLTCDLNGRTITLRDFDKDRVEIFTMHPEARCDYDFLEAGFERIDEYNKEA